MSEIKELQDSILADQQAGELPGILKDASGQKTLKLSYYKKLNNQVENLAVLIEATRSIMAEMDLDALLEKILSQVTRVMHADRSTLFLIDKEKGEIWSRVAQGADILRLPLGQGIVGHVAQTGETLNIPDAYKDERFNSEVDGQTGYYTKSILCMPMKNQHGEILGAIEVLNKQPMPDSVFENQDEKLLAAFAALAGISIENTRAYEEIQQQKDSLEIKVHERTRDLEIARSKSDELLHNILPEEVARELKTDGHARPKRYDLVSVLFTDFKGFSTVAETMKPELLVEELDRCFFYFDEVCSHYNLEKIKTIGDSYMCAGGIPVRNRSNPVECVLAAMEIQSFMAEARRIKETLNEPFWELRLGIHTGPVIAGVVGKQKFAYDIWGETVNTASRMESAGQTGKINISAVTYELVKDFFLATYRGRIPAKKGRYDMYFIDQIKPELSVNGEGKAPNEQFWQKMKKQGSDVLKPH